MAEQEKKPVEVNAEEKEFREKNQWHSFTSATWGALGGAAFFGLLSMMASAVVGLAAGPEAGYMYNMGNAILSNSTPLMVMGGLMTAGIACVYMSQREATELRVLQDEHLAKQQATCMGKAPEVEKVPEVQPEYSQNQRADGKEWKQVLASKEVAQVEAVRI